MNFMEAIKSGSDNYANFNDRTPRSGYWFWILFTVIVNIALGFLSAAPLIGTTAGIASLLFGLAIFIPSISVAARRLHDIDKSGWWMLIVLIPLVGAIVLLVWMCQRGSMGENKYGANPLEG